MTILITGSSITDRANYITQRRIDRIQRMEKSGLLSKDQADTLLTELDWVRWSGRVIEDLKAGHPVPTRTLR
jgi:hypothetical protein